MAFFLRALGHSIFVERRAALSGCGGSLPLAAALLVCMPTDGKASAWGFLYIVSLPLASSHGLHRSRRRDAGVSLLSTVAHLV